MTILRPLLLKNKETILIGDMNCDYLKRSHHKNIKYIISGTVLNNYSKTATRITQESRTLIDIITTTREDRIEKHITIGNSISNHDLIGINGKMNCTKYKPRRIFTRSYAKYDKPAFQFD